MRVRRFVALFAVALLGATFGQNLTQLSVAQAQNQPGSKGPVDLGELTEFLKKQGQVIEKYQQQMQGAQQDAARASEMFDEMIKAYEEIFAKVGSASAQAKLFDQYIADCERFAEEAAKSKSDKIREGADDYRSFAKEARDYKSKFISEADRARANIDALKQLKEEVVDAHRRQKAQEFLAAAKAQLDTLKATNDRMEQTINDAKGKLKPLS